MTAITAPPRPGGELRDAIRATVREVLDSRNEPIKLSSLASLVRVRAGMGTDRTYSTDSWVRRTKEAIQQLRTDDHLPILSDERGYQMARTPEDVARFRHRQIAFIRSSAATLRAVDPQFAEIILKALGQGNLVLGDAS